MTLVVAQAFPGMEWIPVMLFVTAIGVLLGTLSLILRPFVAARTTGRRFGKSALIVGIVSTTFFLIVVGSEIVPFAYLILAAPAFLGGVAFVIYPRPLSAGRGFPVVTSHERNKAG